jgi:hypothetical protein
MAWNTVDEYIQNDPEFRQFYVAKGFQPGQRVKRSDLEAVLDEYRMKQPVEDAAAGEPVLENIAATLPETAMTDQPDLPAVAGAPREDFGGLVPDAPGNALESFAAPEPVRPQPVQQQQSSGLNDNLFRNVLRVRGLQLKAVEPLTKNDREMKQRSQELMESYLDDADSLQQYGIRDVTTYDAVAKTPAEYQDRAWKLVRQQIERGEEPTWMSALETVRKGADATATTSETGTTKDGSPTPIDRLKDAKSVLGETDPAVQQQQERVSRQIQKELGFEIAGNRQEQKDIALAAANALTADPVEGATKFETNLAKLEASQRVLRDNEDAQIAMLRGILGEDAGNSTNVRELVATLNDEQARQFAGMKREAGLSDMNLGAVVIRPGVMTNEEIRRNLTNAIQSNALVLDVRGGKDGMKATSAYQTPESYRALMKEFADPEPGQAAPPSESEKLKQLQEVIKDPARPIVERASAQTEIAKIQKSLAQKGPNRSEEEVKAARQSRQVMLDEFKALFDVTSAREPALKGVFSPIKRNPALDDKTYEESLIRLEELAARLGGAKDGFISRRLPDLQRLRQLLNNPSD